MSETLTPSLLQDIGKGWYEVCNINQGSWVNLLRRILIGELVHSSALYQKVPKHISFINTEYKVMVTVSTWFEDEVPVLEVPKRVKIFRKYINDDQVLFTKSEFEVNGLTVRLLLGLLVNDNRWVKSGCLDNLCDILGINSIKK